MPAGFQVWGADGSLWVDITDRLARFYGSITLGPGPDSQPVAVLNGQGTPFAYTPDPQLDTRTYSGVTWQAPIVSGLSFSGGTPNIDASFSFVSFVNPYVFVYYGAF